MEILKITLIGITGVILAILLKQWKSDFSMYISIATSFLIFVLVSSKIQYIINAFNTFNKFLDSNGSYVGLLLKMAGITYVSEFASAVILSDLSEVQVSPREHICTLHSI